MFFLPFFLDIILRKCTPWPAPPPVARYVALQVICSCFVLALAWFSAVENPGEDETTPWSAVKAAVQQREVRGGSTMLRAD